MLDKLIASIPSYVLLFACFSVAGWCMEVVLKYIQYHRLINRGCLIGPYCPIYGWGAILTTFLCGGVLLPRFSMGETFLAGFFLCGGLEYFVSWYVEKTSHARWWDYSKKPMNLNGRVWIGNLILFGLGSVAIVYLLDPVLLGLFDKLNATLRLVLALVFLAILWSDRVASGLLMKMIRNSVEHQDADNTEEIKMEMHKLLRNRSLLLRRISQAYPDLQPRPQRLLEQVKNAKAEYHAASKRLKGELVKAQNAMLSKERHVSGEIADALQKRVQAIRLEQKQAEEKLHTVENNVFGVKK